MYLMRQRYQTQAPNWRDCKTGMNGGGQQDGGDIRKKTRDSTGMTHLALGNAVLMLALQPSLRMEALDGLKCKVRANGICSIADKCAELVNFAGIPCFNNQAGPGSLLGPDEVMVNTAASKKAVDRDIGWSSVTIA